MRTKYRRDMRASHPHLGGLLLAFRDEPQTIQSWAKGADGERRLGAELNRVANGHIEVLHDRRIPRSQANIDHLVVAPEGVFVIDTKWYKGRVEARTKGPIWRVTARLYVRGYDQSKLVQGMRTQVNAVRSAVGPHVPVIPVLCFINAEWAAWSSHFVIDGVLVTAWKPLRRRLTGPKPPTDDRIARVAAQLEAALPPA